MESSMYARYINEREDKSIFETAKGYATYSLLDNGICYIEDIFVDENFRKENHASRMADSICDLAKGQGYTLLLGSVDTKALQPEASIKVLFGYNMTISHVVGSIIYFKKEIK